MVLTTHTPVDVTTRAHPDITRVRTQQANRLGHICRECQHPGCVGEQREQHEREFAAGESSSLLSTAEYFACPACRLDERSAPGCRDDARHDYTPTPGLLAPAAGLVA
jgi:hypothetical protein